MVGLSDDPALLLIVDDEPDTRLAIATLLESRGYDVLLAGSGEEAIPLARQVNPDVVLLDIRLPGMDGLEALGRIRDENPDQVALVMTGYPSVSTAVRALKDGVTDYVQKPFENHDLLAAVQHAVERARLRREQRRLERELTVLSSVDLVSGLRNRHHFDTTLAREVRRARRQGNPLALLILDLDGFKAYNDRHGHVDGDDLLGTVGESIACQVRAHVDVACRYGGDEFAVVLVDADAVRARSVARRTCAAVRESTAGAITVSVGVATFAEGMDGEALVRAADAAMYEAKAAGGDRVRVFEGAAAPRLP